MNLRRRAAGLLWPNRCDCCGCRIPAEPLLCEDCIRQLAAQRITAADWLRSRTAGMPDWDGAAVCWSYQGTARRGILAAKDGRRGFAAYAGMQLAAAVREQLPDVPFSAVTWVPVSERRRRIQGFSHAELIAAALAESLGLPLRGGLLRDAGSVLRQHDLSAAERAQYAQMRYLHTGTQLSGMHILLCDDVITTGSTVMQCLRLLRECGAAGVYAAAAAATLRTREEAE